MEEQEQKQIDLVRRLMLDDIMSMKKEIISDIRLSTEEVKKIVTASLPKEHDKQHEDIARFMEHSPDPKLHGDHHDFTESIRSKIEHMIVAIFKGLGGIVLLALAVGFYTWIKNQAGH
jgi:hypothetical protein